MNAIQDRCRPKHQVLVLKCYPKTAKGAVDVKPNSSELSYLLYYATSRRSKIQKIGAYLEKKSASDIWRLRIGNVQVTLGILAALIEKSPKDAALIAPTTLKILELILRSDDITMVESSLPTWQAFCENHDQSSLFADQIYLKQYEGVVKAYAQLSSTYKTPGKGTPTRPVAARWRKAGLAAIKSIASSDALGSPSGRQIKIVLPMILENLYTNDSEALDIFVQRAEMEEKVDSDRLLRRRTSAATVETGGTGGDANLLANTASVGDVDRQTEEEIGVLAMQCLKCTFVVSNQSQLYEVTGAMLGFISERVRHGDSVVQVGESRKQDKGWAIKIYSIAAHWAPVQDRYAILIAGMDAMLRIPMKEDNLDSHLVYTAMIGSLLRSDVNMIGLSVMDVLLGLIKQMKKLFSMSGEGSRSGSSVDKAPEEHTPKAALLNRLEKCVGDLAAHVYYADQVGDMISAIIMRLRPTRPTSTMGTPQGEKADGAENTAGASVADLNAESQSQLEAYFSYHQGRVSALKAIKAIFMVANPKSKLAGTMDLTRNRVPVHVWEGTQWLLRDSDGRVRQAYIDALCAWLERETTLADTQAHDEAMTEPRSPLKANKAISETRRAVSNASNRERERHPARRRRSRFLPLLHIAIYDNALQFVDNENDIALLHVLLTKLVFKLGVNATKYGVPMIYRLQEDVLEIEQPLQKVRIASLCHGYFWALSEKFDFEASVIGRAIHNEISRRKAKGFWVNGVMIPVPQPGSIKTPAGNKTQPDWNVNALEEEEILPFDDRTSLVEMIAHGYVESTQSPPTSPIASPGRRFSNQAGSISSVRPIIHAPDGASAELPSSFREQMLVEWSRDAAMTELTSASKTQSVAGSKSGTTGTANGDRLNINTEGNANGYGQRLYIVSPFGSLRPDQRSKYRKSSVRSGLTPSVTGSTRAGVASVDQLKMVLAGDATPEAAGIHPLDDDSGDSMMTCEYPPSEISYAPPENETATSPDTPKRSMSTASQRRGPLGLNPPHEASANLEDEQNHQNGDAVPPVPPLPPSLSGTLNGNRDTNAQDFANAHGQPKVVAKRSMSRGGESTRFSSVRSRRTTAHEEKEMDLNDLLSSIDSGRGEESLSTVTRPPY